MKIREIEIIGHEILGDIKIDFTDSNGRTFDTIILAGENGGGKTTLIDTIYEFSSLAVNVPRSKSRNTFIIEFSPQEINILNSKGFLVNSKNIVKIVRDLDSIGLSRYILYHQQKNNDTWIQSISNFFIDADVKAIFSSIYSPVEINYNPKATQTITSKEVDAKILSSIKSPADIATEIKQMFIDLHNNDASELQDWVDNNDGFPPPDTVKQKRMKRFKNAFGYIFDKLNYKAIKTANNQKDVIFSRGANDISISNLSSGEKQIVFRGGFLLQNQQSTKGCVVLIDEPEISLHPKWQEKILNFYKRLFLDENGNQTSQIFLVTHSPFIIHSKSRYNDKVIVMHRDEQEKIIVEDRPEYINYTDNQVIADAFDITVFNNETKPVVFVEGETDEKYLKKCIEIFKNNIATYEIKWIGKYFNGSVQNSGDTALNQAYNFFAANPNFCRQKVVLLYDGDTNKPDKTEGNLFVRKMPSVIPNKVYDGGIENLLALPKTFDYKSYYRETEKNEKNGAKSIIRGLDKTKLCDSLCAMSVTKQKQYFKELLPILIKVEMLLK